MDHDRKTLILFSLILLIAFTVTFLDIGAYKNENSSDSAISAYSSGNATSISSGDIILYLPPEEGMEVRMEKELVKAFENLGYSVTFTDELKDDYGSQFAFVNVLDTRILYTPVYSSSDIDVIFGYSSSGKTQYLDVEGLDERRTVVFSSNGTDGYQLLVQGNICFHDETKGLFTYRSYHNHLADEVARSVAQALDSQIRTDI
ncbi:hypothetical protein Mpsy_0094 [Methanolobus psychrophilus R15]|nr:hypothetical protein Mpsy_0094 [Methanolobus psychrophilus R15]